MARKEGVWRKEGRRKAPPEQLLFNSPQVAVPMSEVANNGAALVGRRSTNHWLRWAMLGGAGYTQKVSHFAHRPLCVIAALHASPSGLWLRVSRRCSKSPSCSTLLALPVAVCAAPNISAGALRRPRSLALWHVPPCANFAAPSELSSPKLSPWNPRPRPHPPHHNG